MMPDLAEDLARLLGPSLVETCWIAGCFLLPNFYPQVSR